MVGKHATNFQPFLLQKFLQVTSGEQVVSITMNLSFIQKVEDNSILGQYRRIAYVEEFYQIIHDAHGKELLHAGYKKTLEKRL